MPTADLRRGYQLKAVEQLVDALHQQDTACLHMVHGVGRNQVLLDVLERFLDFQVLIICDRYVAAHQISHTVLREKSLLFTKDNIDSDFACQEKIVVTLARPELLKALDSMHFDLVIFYDVRISERLIASFDFFTHPQVLAKRVLFSTAPSTQDIDFFGQPVFSYTFNDALASGVFQQVEYIASSSLLSEVVTQVDYIQHLLADFIRSLLHEPERKAMIVCRNIHHANHIYAACQLMPQVIRPILIHSKVPDVNQALDQFIQTDEYSVAVMVGMAVSIDVPELTDIVLMRRYSTEHLFMQSVATVMKGLPALCQPRIWDFADNKRYFFEAMGSLHIDDRVIELPESISQPIPTSVEVEPEEATTPLDGIDIVETAKRVIQKLVSPCDDKPSKDDLLGRTGLVNILKGIIDRDARKHLIIALFGRWGSGKSTVIELLRDAYASSHHCRFIVFNAWQAEHSHSMAASLANTMINQLYDTKGIVDQALLSIKSRLIRSRSAIVFEIAIVFVISAFILGLGFPQYIEWSATGFSVGALLLLIPLLFSAIKSYLHHPFTAKLKELSKRPDFNLHIGLGHHIREQLSCLLEAYSANVLECFRPFANNTYQYILVIDDLDRCSDGKIMEALEAIQLIIDLDNVVVILAVDHQMLLEAVAARYRKQRDTLSVNESLLLAREFLGKILQITISLDKVSQRSREQFIQQRLYNFDELEQKTSADFKKIKGVKKERADGIASLFYFDGYSDDYHESYDQSDEYLIDQPEECDWFNQCALLFDEHNPRTLIRIHNIFTLLKGLYPDIVGDSVQCKRYMYFTFWFEVYSTSMPDIQKSMLKTIQGLYSKVVINDEDRQQLEQFMSLKAVSTQELQQVLDRIISLSLPSAQPIIGSTKGAGVK